MPTRRLFQQTVKQCDVTLIPSIASFAVEVNADNPLFGDELKRTRLYVCDRALAKFVAADPSSVDAEAGVVVPTAPSPRLLNYVQPQYDAQNTLWLHEYQQRIDQLYKEQAERGFVVPVVVVQETSHVSSAKMRSSAMTTIQSQCLVVMTAPASDEYIECHYTTAIDPEYTEGDRENTLATTILARNDIADVAYGNAVLVRRSIVHGTPLGLQPHALRKYFGSIMTAATVPRRRIRSKEAEARRKRMRRMQQANALQPEDGEFQAVRVSTDDVNPFSRTILPAENESLVKALSELQQWRGDFSEVAVGTIGSNTVFAIVPDRIGMAEYAKCQTAVNQSAYVFNTTADRLLSRLDAKLCFGVVVLVMRDRQQNLLNLGVGRLKDLDQREKTTTATTAITAAAAAADAEKDSGGETV